jgi:uncharacterized Zn-finger protein
MRAGSLDRMRRLGIIPAAPRSTRGRSAQAGENAMATDIPEPPEIIEVDQLTVACDGGGALGHPRVWLTLEEGRAECGYCDRLFVLREGAHPAGH